MTMGKHILILLAVLMLQACAAYKKYQPVETVQPDLYGAEVAEAAAGDTASIATMEWREFFRDPRLQQLIDTALLHNSDLRIAMERTRQAEASLGAAKLAYFPMVNLGADGSVGRYDGLTTKTYNIGLNASWEVDIFGKLTAAKRQAAAAAVEADAEAQAVRTQLLATVASSYYSLMMLDRQIAIGDSTLANWDESIRVMELLKNAGLANEPGILQAKANRVALQGDIVEMKRSRKEVENSLCRLLGRVPGPIERGTIDQVSFPELKVGMPVSLLANRPDVRSAEMEMARAHYGVGIARASFYPSLTLGGTLGFTNNGGVVVNPGQWLLNAVAQLAQPIFNRGQLKAAYKIAESDREIARIRFSQTLLDAGTEVNDALSTISAAGERNKLARQRIGLLESTVAKTELLMRHSPTNYLEVLTAQQALLEAQQAEVQTLYDEIAGIITLYHALGGGMR